MAEKKYPDAFTCCRMIDKLQDMNKTNMKIIIYFWNKI